MSTPNLIRKNEFLKLHTEFTPGQLDNWLFNRGTNGLSKSGAVIKVDRAVFIDQEKFYEWIVSHTET